MSPASSLEMSAAPLAVEGSAMSIAVQQQLGMVGIGVRA